MKEDTRIIALLKTCAKESYEKADKAVGKVMEVAWLREPEEDLEKFIYWLLLNYYSYCVVKDIEERTERKNEN